MKRFITITTLLFAAVAYTFSQETTSVVLPSADTTTTAILADTTTATPTDAAKVTKKEGFFAQWWHSLVKGNQDKTFEKKADISFALAPYYSQESSFGIGGQLSALYRLDRKDSLMQPSDLTLMGGGSINGTYSVGLQGHINWTRGHRMNYILEFQSQSRDFWGIDYNCCASNPATKVRFNRINVSADHEMRFAGHWFWGVAVRMKYGAIKELDFEHEEYIQGQDTKGFFSGLGLSVVYDTRDFILNPKKGMMFMLRHIYYPKQLGTNDYAIGYTTAQFNFYHPLWKDAIMAYDLFAETNITDGKLPWQMRELICNDDRRMRGYYAGSYMDNNQVCVQAEIRQHIYKRFGCVAWGGLGTFFNTFESFNVRQYLPNYGVGLRFEMKKNTNLRMDLGFGRGTSGIIFNFGEAF